MNLINDLRELAEYLHVNGYNRYSAAMTKAADELAKWEAVFGHLGDTPDECGNAIIAARDELEERCVTLTDALPGTQPTLSVPDDVVEQAVNRFLSWKLPKDFRPDGGMVFIPTKRRGHDSPHWPTGTNLLNAQQTREMLHYVLAAAPETKP